MNRPVVLSRQAQREFDEAADWYEQQAGLGARFTERVRDVLRRVEIARVSRTARVGRLGNRTSFRMSITSPRLERP
jgi:plasmid stabilization system protein ParE